MSSPGGPKEAQVKLVVAAALRSSNARRHPGLVSALTAVKRLPAFETMERAEPDPDSQLDAFRRQLRNMLPKANAEVAEQLGLDLRQSRVLLAVVRGTKSVTGALDLFVPEERPHPSTATRWMSSAASRISDWLIDRSAAGGDVTATDQQAVVAIDGLDLRTQLPWRVNEVPTALGWAITGRDADLHLAMRAYGRTSVTQKGDLFYGREEELGVVTAWLLSEQLPLLPLVVTGAPGSGKSGLVTRAVLSLDRHARGLFIHASRMRVHELLAHVAKQLGLAADSSLERLLYEVSLKLAQRISIVVDSLDEMESADDISEARRFLRELSTLPQCRVVVATRSLASDDPYRPGGHLHSLGVTAGAKSRNIVDLESPKWLDRDSVVNYAVAQLTREGFPEVGEREIAATSYRKNPAKTKRLAELIVDRARLNFLVAGIVSSTIAKDEFAIDPDSAEFKPGQLPSGAVEALERTLRRLQSEPRERARRLLITLSYARGAGVTEELWLALASALGFADLTLGDIQELLSGPACDYVITVKASEGTTRNHLFHQALSSDLQSSRHVQQDERRILEALRAEGGPRGWLGASSYGCEHAPSHAQAGGLLSTVLLEPDFLVAASPIALHAELRHPDDTVELVAGVHTSALHMLGRDIGANASILGLSARIEGHRPLAEQLDALDVERPFWLRGWVRPLMRARTWFEGHIGPVYGSCAIRHRGRPHIVSAGADATVRVWDPLHPDAEIARFVGHRGAVRDVQTLPTSDEAHDLVVSASDDGTACVWDPSSPDAPLVVFRKHQGAVRCAAILPWIEVPHAVATGSANGTVRIWDPATSEELQEFSSGNSAINDLLVIGWPTPPHIAITAATDEGVVVWDPLTPRRLARPFSPFSAKGGRSPGSTVGALAFAGFDRGSPLIAYGKSDREIVVWNPVRQRKVSHYLGHSAGIVDMSAVEWPDFDRPLVLTTSEDGVRVWDPLNPSLTIKRIEPGNASIGRGYNLPGLETPTVVTATTDGRVQVWGADVLDEQDALAAPPGWLWEVVSLEGPDAASLRVAVATTDNRAVILDLSSVQPREVRSLTGHTDTVVGLATVGSRAGATLLVTTSDDATARVWDLERDLPEVRRYEGHEDKVWGAAALRLPHHRGTSVATTSADQTIRIWLPLTGETIAVLRGHRAGVWRVRSGPWPGLPHEVLVSTSADETARVWDPLEPNDPIAVLRGHAHVVVDAAFVPVDGWPGGVLVTTSDDKTAIIWDPTNGDRLGTLVGHDGPVSGVAALYWPPLGRHVIITTSEDSTLRGWDPGAGWKEMLRIPLVAPGHAILPLQRAHVAVTTSRGLELVEFCQSDKKGAQ